MERISISELAKRVATLLGESLAPECEPLESPFPDLEDRVRELAPGLLLQLLCRDRDARFSMAKRLAGELTVDSDGVATLELPEDFLMLLSVRLSGWRGPVTTITDPDTLEGFLQGSRWKGLRGVPERPVAIKDIDDKGKACLRLYTGSPDATLESGWYVAIPNVDSDDTLAIPDLKSHALVHLAHDAINPVNA